MKLTLINLIKKITKSCFLQLLLLDLILIIFFRYYQPLCEPCINLEDCPACLSKEQYWIIFFGLIANSIFLLYYLGKIKKLYHV